MEIILLLVGLAALDVLMLCYSLYLDKKIGELKGIDALAVQVRPVIRMGRFERFVHSPLGTLVLAVCFIGSLIAMREAEKRDGIRDTAPVMGKTVPDGQSMTLPCTDIQEVRDGQLVGR